MNKSRNKLGFDVLGEKAMIKWSFGGSNNSWRGEVCPALIYFQVLTSFDCALDTDNLVLDT